MKNISAWAIRHPVLPMVLFAVLLFAGTVAFIRLPVTQIGRASCRERV